ncbi:hypothetical protein VQH23_05695 [Pararoseomonas sp. SCSIO 73927]|uniref:hypothetical protein n=1 Tax=Pararoseomonas sp. SCSIO 73927 TaxID=3114537 RepID=UPI0030D51AD7
MTIIAALALVALDFFILTVMFLYRPAGAEILAGVMLAGALAAVLLRWRWLFFASQNVVTAVTVLRLVQWEGPEEIAELAGPILFVLLLALGNLLAWFVARIIPPRHSGLRFDGPG